MIADIKRRLALACSRGTRQTEFLNEALVGPVPVVLVYVPGSPGGVTLVYGAAKLGHSSYQNLRKRLVDAGFIVSRSDLIRAQPGRPVARVTVSLPGID